MSTYFSNKVVIWLIVLMRSMEWRNAHPKPGQSTHYRNELYYRYIFGVAYSFKYIDTTLLSRRNLSTDILAPHRHGPCFLKK